MAMWSAIVRADETKSGPDGLSMQSTTDFPRPRRPQEIEAAVPTRQTCRQEKMEEFQTMAKEIFVVVDGLYQKIRDL